MNERNDAPEEWAGDAVLNALGVDRWDKHVDEMLKYDSRPVPGPMATDVISTSDQFKIKDLIRRELAARMDDKIKEIVNAAIAARLPTLSQPNNTNTKANMITNNINGKILRDLNQLQRLERDERSLKFELVDRLFQIPAGGLGQPGSRFATSTRGLQYGDKVTSVLVSFVEALVVKVNMLQTKVDAMEYVLEAYPASKMTADRLAEEVAAVIAQETDARITQGITAVVTEAVSPPMAKKTTGHTVQEEGPHITWDISEVIDEATAMSLEASNADPIKGEDGKKKRKKRGKKKNKSQQGVDDRESPAVPSDA